MAYPVTLNGRTYTLADFEGTNYVDGLPDAFEDFVTHAGDIYNDTSSTSNAIGTGSKTFTVSSAKPYQAGTPLRIADSADPSTNFMDTVVTSYSGTTLVVNSIGYGGSGTKTSWTINIGGAKTIDGTLGLSQGGSGATSAADARTNFDVYSKSEADSRFLNVSGEASDVVITGSFTSPGIDDNASSTALTIASGGDVTFASDAAFGGGLTGVTGINGGQTGAFNRIINGDMRIDQRNAGASVTPANGNYTLDRWGTWVSQASKLTIQQNAGAVTPPAGFTNYLGVTSSSAYSVISSDYFGIWQGIEGLNVADLAWGTASAKTITVSFWVRSSLTGTFGGMIQNAAGNRGYTYSYSISSANTWEYKTITISGDTTGTWTTDTTRGLQLYFNLAAGSSNTGTAGSWGSTFYQAPTGAVSIVGTSGATFYLTGVQLEAGPTATEFSHRSFGEELALCQRYYEKSYEYGTALGAATYNGTTVYGGGVTGSTTSFIGSAMADFAVPKRATPTVVWYDVAGTSGKCQRWLLGTHNTNGETVTSGSIGAGRISAYSGSGTSGSGIIVHWTASAEI